MKRRISLIPGISGFFFIIMGALLLKIPQLEVAWTMMTGGAIMVIIAGLYDAFAGLSARIEKIEDALAQLTQTEKK
jgi:hypothetical protein